jgi:hypothetical protein
MKKQQKQNLNRISSIEDAEEFDIENDAKYEKISNKRDKIGDFLEVFDAKKPKNIKQSKIDEMLKDFEDVRRSLLNDKYYD